MYPCVLASHGLDHVTGVVARAVVYDQDFERL
jgi:hypothetical protein